ncbi:trehalose-phosphatase [Candidatus Amarobacter glycogenicus]|jgi:trehalose 6-phosphate phosphatase|uniref:trehalose-phosphatase n=1 Tax=Candidatus Amarobacter glycogenicus TaxID=3140699 RepID=UPI002A0BCBEB|nr:trehalose-phosphatase [Dehalococcoidia bacterium]MBK8560548.1 trehalose-phosphatase [Dehalococcoidia bacterium]MBK9610359.1 trehalose-phosphatase [Dehalococcoidia bacterium]
MLNLAAIEQFRGLAAARGPLLVATDLDGTLAPIVAHASEARVPPGTLAVLDRLSQAAKVAVITGRDLNTARRMVPVEGVVVVGSHGLEASFDDPLIPGVDRVALSAALEAIEQRVISACPSSYLHIERKAISTAFHFRTAPDLEPGLRQALATLPEGLRLREGRMVLEVLPDARGGKDIALSALTRQLRARALLVMGDDATDVAMFRAALSLAQTERVHVMLVGVSGGAETPPEITELSDVVVRSTEEALEGLETVARALGV